MQCVMCVSRILRPAFQWVVGFYLYFFWRQLLLSTTIEELMILIVQWIKCHNENPLRALDSGGGYRQGDVEPDRHLGRPECSSP